MITEYKGRAQFPLYLAVIGEVEGGTISPGGAARLLHISRQGASDLIRRSQEVRAWAYLENWNDLYSYLEASVVDLIRYGVRRGRIRRPSDVGLWWPGRDEIVNAELARCAAQYQPEPREVQAQHDLAQAASDVVRLL